YLAQSDITAGGRQEAEKILQKLTGNTGDTRAAEQLEQTGSPLKGELPASQTRPAKAETIPESRSRSGATAVLAVENVSAEIIHALPLGQMYALTGRDAEKAVNHILAAMGCHANTKGTYTDWSRGAITYRVHHAGFGHAHRRPAIRRIK
ncbi:MAG: hypothetical protein JSV68_10630, partial [Anaerolineaceae bacterium]